VQAQLEAKLQEALTPVHLEVTNESHGECSGLQDADAYRWLILKSGCDGGMFCALQARLRMSRTSTCSSWRRNSRE